MLGAVGDGTAHRPPSLHPSLQWRAAGVYVFCLLLGRVTPLAPASLPRVHSLLIGPTLLCFIACPSVLHCAQMLKGMLTATLCPALSLYLTRHNLSHAYCGIEPHGWLHFIGTFFIIWLGTDLWEFLYHYLGHKTAWGWANHKHHHLFFNPSPFAVIAGVCQPNPLCSPSLRLGLRRVNRWRLMSRCRQWLL